MNPSDNPLTTWRQKLHGMPEVSGEEHHTAEEVVQFLSATRPDNIITGLGGTGVAVIYEGAAEGPTVMFRAELDALPIEEISEAQYRSRVPGKGHMCGHDGHMATLAALGHSLSQNRPARGRAILLFQPAEETGAGAAAVLADPRFSKISPDFSFSLHNMPGVPFGLSWLKEGAANCASRGLKIALTGKTAHASMPETGVSPAPAIATLLPSLTALSGGSIETGDLTLATVTHVSIGEPAFGIAPGHGEVWVTLRAISNDRMDSMIAAAEKLALDTSARHGLEVTMTYHDVFRDCVNHPEAVALLRKAMDQEGLPHAAGQTIRASEDFGRFADVSKSAMFFLGAGEDHPALHNPNYDFPDALIPIGARIFHRIALNLLG